MPNWCLNDITFYTNNNNLKELKKLHKNISCILNSTSKIENGFGNSWLGNIAEFHNISYKEVPSRGLVSSINEIDIETSSFRITTETAWVPMHELWVKVLDTYKEIESVYLAEESGNGIYVNNDEERFFYNESYVAYNFSDDEDVIKNSLLYKNDFDYNDYFYTTMYFDTEEEIINTFNKILVKKVNSYAELVRLEDSNEFNFTLNKFKDTFL